VPAKPLKKRQRGDLEAQSAFSGAPKMLLPAGTSLGPVPEIASRRRDAIQPPARRSCRSASRASRARLDVEELVHRNGSFWLLGLAALALAACHPTKEEYKAKEAEVAQLKAKLSESEQRASSLEARLKDLGDKNDTLAQQLNLAGVEKGTLERALEELKSREKQSQARLAVFTEMLNKFRAMIDSGKLRVRVVRGRMVVELAENILFDSGRADLKKEGQEALAQVAAVLQSIENRDFQVAGHTDNIPI